LTLFEECADNWHFISNLEVVLEREFLFKPHNIKFNSHEYSKLHTQIKSYFPFHEFYGFDKEIHSTKDKK